MDDRERESVRPPRDGRGADEARPPQYQIIIQMNTTLGMRITNNCPSGDAVEMMLYRALKYVERELTAGRLFKVEEPKITLETSLPKRVE